MKWLDALITGIIHKLYPMPEDAPVSSYTPPTAPYSTITITSSPSTSESPVEPDWDSRRGARKATRILCDASGLTFEQKNDLCACVFQESGFLANPKPNQNKDKTTGLVWSTDYGIVQVNDYYNIGAGKEFSSVEEVLANPAKCVQWMINILKTTGKLQPWASWTTGAYKQWLPAVSTDDAFDALLTRLNLLG